MKEPHVLKAEDQEEQPIAPSLPPRRWRHARTFDELPTYQTPATNTAVLSEVSEIPPAPPPQEGKPDSHLGLSVFSCMCCCWPIGLAAWISSCQVDDAYIQGYYQVARERSQSARRLSFVSIVVGVVFWILAGTSASVFCKIGPYVCDIL
mmetsp:Transcript_26273/g.41270  ORF Transcript_26273/g.41270 Transcript_26273/m.41270 type:complete len:150 (-) Transcript_26273:99-548(-)